MRVHAQEISAQSDKDKGGLSVMGLPEIGEKNWKKSKNPLFFTPGTLPSPNLTPEINSVGKNT